MLSQKLKEPSLILDVVQTIVAVAVALVLALDMTGLWSGPEWLSANLPSITFIAVCLLIVSSFLERHLQISKFSSEVNGKLDDILTSKLAGIKLQDRSGLTIPFETRIQNAKDVYLLGITLSGMLSHYFAYIVSRANSGCRFHFLILDPNYTYSTGEKPKPWTGMTRRQLDTKQSVQQLALIMEQTNNVVVGFVPSTPPFSLLIIDPEQSHGEVQVELHTYDVPESNQPHFVIRNSDGSSWYSFFINQFQFAVKKSRIMTSKDVVMAKKH